MPNIDKMNHLTSDKNAGALPGKQRKTARELSLPAKGTGRRARRDKQTEYILFSPVHYEPKYAYPLIVWFHSPGADENEIFQVMPKLSLQNYVAVAPRGLTFEESASGLGSDLEMLPVQRKSLGGYAGMFSPLYDWTNTEQGIEEAENRFFDVYEKARTCCNINRRRVFLAGVGTGGSMALRIGARHPEMVAGVVSLSGGFQMNNLPLKRWSLVRNLPIMLMVGAKNPVFSPAHVARQLRLFHTAGMSVSIRQYKTADDATDMMFRDINRWIMDLINGTNAIQE